MDELDLDLQLFTQRIVHFQDVMPAGQEHLDAAAHAHHAALDGGILEARRQPVLLAPVASDLAPSIGEFELEPLASAMCGDRVPAFALLEDEDLNAVPVRAPAVGQAPGRKSVARAPRLLAQAGFELRQRRQRQAVFARRIRRGEELRAMALDQAGVEIGAYEIAI